MKRVWIIERGFLYCSVSCLCDLCVFADAVYDTISFPDHVRFYRDGAPENPVGPAEFRRAA